MLGAGFIESARLVALAHRLGGTALPVAGAAQRVRVFGAVVDPGEMGGGGRRIVEEAQRDPAGGEMLVGAVVATLGAGRVTGDAVGGLGIVVVEQTAHQKAALHPPTVGIDQGVRILRRRQHQLGGFFRFAVGPQPLCAREDVTRVAARRGRYCIKQGLGVLGAAGDRGARPRDQQLVAAKTFGGAHGGGDVVVVEPLVHPHFVIFAGDGMAELRQNDLFDVGAGIVLAPRQAGQSLGGGAIALRQQRAGINETAFGGGRLPVIEEGADSPVVQPVVPQGILGAASEQRRVRPGRVRFDEIGVAAEAGIGVVAAQHHPFGQLLGDGIRYRFLRGVGGGAVALADRLDDLFDEPDIGGRGGATGRHRKRAGRRTHQRVKIDLRGQRAAHADTGLGEGRERGGLVRDGRGAGPLGRQRHHFGARGSGDGRLGRRGRDGVDGRPGARHWNLGVVCHSVA